MFFDLNLNKSQLIEKDICTMMPSLELPLYKDLALTDLSIKYKGGIKKFNAQLDGLLNSGRINLDTDLDFSGEKMKYGLKFFTKDLNVVSFTNTNTNLNLTGNINGIGTSIKDITADVVLNAVNSQVINYSIDSLNFNCSAKDKLIKLNFSTGLNKAIANLTASLDFTNESVPKYQLEGKVKELNIGRFLLIHLLPVI